MADCNAVAVSSRLLVVDRMFTSGGVYVCARLFVDHRCINVYSRVKLSWLVSTMKLF